MESKAPPVLVFFGYNRPEKLEACLKSVIANPQAKSLMAYIFIDGPKNNRDIDDVTETISVAERADGFLRKTIFRSASNKGLANSIIFGLDTVFKKHESAIILEDDLVVSSGFLPFMTESLEKYRDVANVISVHGYTYPCQAPLPDYFFLRGADCWGWATWRDRWEHFEKSGEKLLNALESHKDRALFDFNGAYPYLDLLRKQVKGTVDSWAIRWYASAFLGNFLTLYPGTSFVENTGNDGSGTHSAVSKRFEVMTSGQFGGVPELDVCDSPEARRAFEDYFRETRGSLVSKFFERMNGFLLKTSKLIRGWG